MKALFSDRNRLPRWVNRAVDFVADNPTGLLGRIAARRLGRPDPSNPTPVSIFRPLPLRLLIAPVNYSGQGREWARAIEELDSAVSAQNMAIDVPGGFSFDADLIVPVPVYNNDRDWQERQFAAASTATHVLIEAQEPPFGRMMGRDVGRQAEALLAEGVNVAFMTHGTDIRLPSRHLQRTPWSHFADPAIYSPRLEALARRNRELLDRLERPVFVSTPDLLADVSGGIWCPVVVDPQRWAAPFRSDLVEDRPLRVVHAPSAAPLKGTHLIASTLEKLDNEGVIDYRQISGVPSAKMPAVFHDADIYLDQFRVGSYGVAACEAMAAGCLVIGHVLDEVRDVVAQQMGLELPIHEATPDTLEQVLRGLVHDRNQVAAAGEHSIAFVRAVHDGRISSAILMNAWLRPQLSTN